MGNTTNRILWTIIGLLLTLIGVAGLLAHSGTPARPTGGSTLLNPTLLDRWHDADGWNIWVVAAVGVLLALLGLWLFGRQFKRRTGPPLPNVVLRDEPRSERRVSASEGIIALNRPREQTSDDHNITDIPTDGTAAETSEATDPDDLAVREASDRGTDDTDRTRAEATAAPSGHSRYGLSGVEARSERDRRMRAAREGTAAPEPAEDDVESEAVGPRPVDGSTEPVEDRASSRSESRQHRDEPSGHPDDDGTARPSVPGRTVVDAAALTKAFRRDLADAPQVLGAHVALTGTRDRSHAWIRLDLAPGATVDALHEHVDRTVARLADTAGLTITDLDVDVRPSAHPGPRVH